MEPKRLNSDQKKIPNNKGINKTLNSKSVNDVLKFIVSIGLGCNLLLACSTFDENKKIINFTVATLCAAAITAQLIRNARMGKNIERQR